MIADVTDLVGGLAAAGLWAARSITSGRPVPPPPMLTHASARARHVHRTVEYTDGQKLDIWRPRGDITDRPVLLFIPGGGWVIGQRRPQAYALLSRMVEAGWVCVAIDYRTAPLHHWPAPFVDVRLAYEWVRNNIGFYGGDPDFVAMSGASAGGHMASLAGLLWEDAPDAVASIYGSYDWEGRRTLWRQAFMTFLETVVVGTRQSDHPDLFRGASPIANVHSDAPPWLIVHGTKDRLISVKEARRFYAELDGASDSAVDYLEIKGGAHAFDLVNPAQTERAVDGIGKFLTHHYFGRVIDRVRAEAVS